MASFTENSRLSSRFASALQVAFEAHQFQIRKQGEVPYISHLMAVSSLVLEAGGTEDEAIAALLHDAIEDAFDNPQSPAYRDDRVKEDYRIAECFDFGWEVATIVDFLSEAKELPKEQRKKVYIESVKKGGDSVQLVSCADKLHNLRSYATDGRSLWSADKAEFYSQLLPIYANCKRIPSSWIAEMSKTLLDLRP